jgi:hypothetical protein
MPGNELQRLDWRKAQRSMSNGACVEVALATRDVIIRDSQDPSGPVLRYPVTSWDSFVSAARAGYFDIPRLGELSVHNPSRVCAAAASPVMDGAAWLACCALPGGPIVVQINSFITAAPDVPCVVIQSRRDVMV